MLTKQTLNNDGGLCCNGIQIGTFRAHQAISWSDGETKSVATVWRDSESATKGDVQPMLLHFALEPYSFPRDAYSSTY